MSKNDDLVRRLQPCPFCGDPMHAQGGLIRHVEQTEGCPIKQEAWDIGQKDRWNSRAIERGAAHRVADRAAMIVEGWSTAQNHLPDGVDGGWLAERDLEMGEAIRSLSTPPAPAPDAGEDEEAVEKWLEENCGRGIPHGEATDTASMLHGLAYILRQIEATDTYRPNIGQTVSATSALRMALRHFARAALGDRT